MPFCTKCNEFVLDRNVPVHQCPPTWRVWADGYGDEDDAQKVMSRTPEGAAEKWAEAWDCDGDYTIVGGSEVKVTVLGSDGTRHRFEVSGEVVPEYTASALDEEDAGS